MEVQSSISSPFDWWYGMGEVAVKADMSHYLNPLIIDQFGVIINTSLNAPKQWAKSKFFFSSVWHVFEFVAGQGNTLLLWADICNVSLWENNNKYFDSFKMISLIFILKQELLSFIRRKIMVLRIGLYSCVVLRLNKVCPHIFTK